MVSNATRRPEGRSVPEGLSAFDRFQEKISGVCVIAGALLWAPTTYFDFSGGLYWAGALGMVLYILFIPGLLGIARLLNQPSPHLAGVVGLLIAAGCVGGAAFHTALLHEWAALTAGAPDTMMIAVREVTESRIFPLLVIFSIQFPVSLLVLGVGLLRTRTTPTWVSLLLAIGAVIFPIGHIGGIQVVQHLAETVLLIPLVWIGLRFLRRVPQRNPVPAST